jgi:chlorobactene glucosyltransferase
MAIQIITWLLFFALFYLLITALIFLRNRFDLTPLYTKKSSDIETSISVCIPARNEEDTIGALLSSLADQTWTNYTVHVLDDQSTDRTFEIADSYQEKYPDKFFVYSGVDKPDDWLGKPWACFQLSKKSAGELMLFLDADTVVKPNFLEHTVYSIDHFNLDMLTVWPRQKLLTFWEQTIIPLFFFTLLSLLPSIYVYRVPRWMPKKIRKEMAPKFAAACGQCMAFKRDTYEKIGGHESVKNQVVEDVELAKVIKEHGYTLRMFSGIGSISCRMYNNGKEIFEGFRKNFLQGFNNNIPAFIAAGILHFIVFVLPFFAFILSFILYDPVIFFLSLASISIILIERFILAIWYKTNPFYAFTHPLAVLWFQALAIVKIRDYYSGRNTVWKGRKV